MDILSALTGSRVRADVVAALFGVDRRAWKVMELERATRRSHSPLHRELARLVKAGLLRTSVHDGRRHFEPDPDGPVARELTRIVRQTRGRIPRIRHALIALRSPTVAWVVAPRADPVPAGRGRRIDLLVVTGAPRSLVRVQLAHLLTPEIELHCMSIHEWVARLDKNDLFLRRARRTAKLWVLGSWETLLARERAQIESKRLLRAVTAKWHEELSDEWDEDWDPFAPLPGTSP